ncbi:hypothetical protein ACVWW3_006782 [Bradyrhizobium sp. LM2.9]
MRDHRKPERAGTWRAKQQSMRGDVGIRRWHAPLLPAKWITLRSGRAKRDLGAQRRRSQQGQERQKHEGVEEPHELPEARTATVTLIGTNQYRQTFCVAIAVHSLPQSSFAPTHGTPVPFESAPCLFSVQHGENTDAESPQVNP